MELLFSKNLRYLRKLNNITQMEFSVIMQKKHTTIGNWEKRTSRPNIEELVEIAQYFNFSVESLLLEDLTNVKGNKEHFEKDVAEEKEPDKRNNEKNVYANKLIESLQLNVQSLQQIISNKNTEVQHLQTEITFLKHHSKAVTKGA